MSPATTRPLFTAMRIRRGAGSMPDALMSSRARYISMAVLTARSAWSGWAKGTPNTAITASPMYLSSVPSFWKITSVTAVKKQFRMRATSDGSSFSAMEVKPTRSENSTVISRSSVFIMTSPPEWMIRLTTDGEW